MQIINILLIKKIHLFNKKIIKSFFFSEKIDQQNKNIIMMIKDLNPYLSKLLYSSGSGTRTHTDITVQRIFLPHLLLHKHT